MNYKTNSTLETMNVAKAFSSKLIAGDVVCLYGDLGAGKTAFVQGLAKGLGVTENVNSPTFTIINCYEGRLPVYHFDVYRIADCDEMYEIGYDEYVGGDGIAVIEWAGNISEILPAERYDITICRGLQHEDFRTISIEKRG